MTSCPPRLRFDVLLESGRGGGKRRGGEGMLKNTLAGPLGLKGPIQILKDDLTIAGAENQAEMSIFAADFGSNPNLLFSGPTNLNF